MQTDLNATKTELQTARNAKHQAVKNAEKATYYANYYKDLANKYYSQLIEVQPSRSHQQDLTRTGVADAWAAQALLTRASEGGSRLSAEQGGFAAYNDLQTGGLNALQSGQATMLESNVFSATSTE
jgi:hypothetical protein